MEKASKVVLNFAKERDWEQFHTPENLAKSISIEAGELLECFQWDSSFNEEEVHKELADVVIYCIHLANKLGVATSQIQRWEYGKNQPKVATLLRMSTILGVALEDLVEDE